MYCIRAYQEETALLNIGKHVYTFLSIGIYTQTHKICKVKSEWFCLSFIYQKLIVFSFVYHRIFVFQYYFQSIWEKGITKIQYAERQSCYVLLKLITQIFINTSKVAQREQKYSIKIIMKPTAHPDRAKTITCTGFLSH